MKPFQLDESCNDRRLVQICVTEGKCEVRPFPAELRNKGKKDWEIFPILLGKDAPLVTTDFNIAFDERNRRAMPASISGILVIRPRRPFGGYGSREAVPILTAFKVRFPSWAEIDWSNVYAEITDIDVYIATNVKDAQVGGVTIGLDEANFATTLQETITAAQAAVRPRAIS